MTLRNLFAVAAVTLLAVADAQASVEISANPTKNMNCTGGVCAPTAKNAVLNATDLANMLASGDVKVVTGNGAVTITVSSSFSWTSTHRLTLDANYNVSFRAPVVVAGQGAVTIVTNDGGTSGDLLFFPGGSLDFWDTGSSLIIDSEAYALAKSVQELRKKIEKNPDRNYALANDYDASTDKVYRPIKPALSGKIEGLGNTIKNINIQTGGNIGGGLFKSINASGVIRDLNITGLSITAYTETNPIGGLAGSNEGTIQSVTISGTMFIERSYDTGAGLLVGGNGGTILNSSAAGSINAYGGVNTWVGGLSGGGGKIVDSHSSVDIQNASVGGGLVGYGYMVINCYATGNVSGGAVGGLVGELEGEVSGSFATGAVSGCCGVGGLVGFSERGDPDTYIVNSYSTGPVSDNSGSAGGLIGSKIAYLQQVYSLGAVTGSQAGGGLVGYENTNYGTNTSAYWDMDTSGISNPSQGAGSVANDAGITGLTDTQLKAKLPTGFDTAIWGRKKSINNGYPYLLANPPPQ
jgi:hypothetical protein